MSPAEPSPAKPMPMPTPTTAQYWAGAADGELRIQFCHRCQLHYFYPRPTCPHCGSADVSWAVACGRARLHTYLINHRPAPGFPAPYAIAIVELAEGPRLMTNIVGIPNTPEHLRLDMMLRVVFEPRGDQWVPVFTPAVEQ